MSGTAWGIDWAERGWIPDFLLRQAIRRLCGQRLHVSVPADCEQQAEAVARFVAASKSMPIAVVPEAANAQHYEVPADFFHLTLGPHRKYSCCHWASGITTLAKAEESALALTCERAELANGQRILELGCGWGSLTLWMAAKFPGSRITAVSNSASQREFILRTAEERRLTNIDVLTADMNEFAAPDVYDRIVSVEMFEHLRNWEMMFQRISNWLTPDGRLFLHVFSHRTTPYLFETEGDDDWMARHFFSGGIMPCDTLPLHHSRNLRVERQWSWNGRHYEKTANAWLKNLDARRSAARAMLEMTQPPEEAARQVQRWRIFFLAVAELFGYRQGNEWRVTHTRFHKR